MQPWMYTALIGMISGGLAGRILRGRGLGLIGNIFLGIGGAFVGTWLDARLNLVSRIGFLNTLGEFQGLATEIITATGGAIILLMLSGFFKRG